MPKGCDNLHSIRYNREFGKQYISAVPSRSRPVGLASWHSRLCFCRNVSRACNIRKALACIYKDFTVFDFPFSFGFFANDRQLRERFWLCIRVVLECNPISGDKFEWRLFEACCDDCHWYCGTVGTHNNADCSFLHQSN